MRSLPVLLQTEASECGLVCLAMIAGHHGQRVELSELRARFSTSLKGITLSQLAQHARQLKLQGRALRCDMDELAQLQLPCLLHWDFGHFVVLAAVRGRNAVIHDPAVGRRRLPLAELSQHFTGVALELTPQLDFRSSQPAPRVDMNRMLRGTPGLGVALGQVVLAGLAIEVFSTLLPILLQWLVDDALPSEDTGLVGIIAMGMLLLGLARAVTFYARGMVVTRFSARTGAQWSQAVASHLYRLPVAFFEKRFLGDVASRFDAVHHIQHVLTSSVVEAVVDGFVAVLSFAIMLAYSPLLAAIVIALVVLYAAIRALRYGMIRAVNENLIVRTARQKSHFLESLRGIATIKLFNAQGARLAQYMSMTVDVANIGVRVNGINVLYFSLGSAFATIEVGAIVMLGAGMVIAHSFTIGMLLAFLAYKDEFVRRMNTMVDRIIDLRMLTIQSGRLADIVLTPPEPEPAVPYLLLEPLVSSLELRALRFRYAAGEPLLLDGANLFVAPGEAVAIVGPSGAGKTTLLKLMTSQLLPTNGQVLLGGVDIARFGYMRYRDMIGVVMQDDQLFAGTVAENICFFAPSPDQSWIEECARAAEIHDEIRRMPMSYNSLVGDMGTSLSGGQKQRLFLARALYKRPKVLFLDEATSHLDQRAEAAVNEAIRRIDVTRIIVAHRRETIEMADRAVDIQHLTRVRSLRQPGPIAANVVTGG